MACEAAAELAVPGNVDRLNRIRSITTDHSTNKFSLSLILPGGIGDIGEGGLSSSASSLVFISSTYFERNACK